METSSRSQKDFTCREEKRTEEKRRAAWGHAAGPRNWWYCGAGWKLGFIGFLFCLRMEMSLLCKQTFSGKKYLPG
jgi:hypothetical protein